MVFRYTKLCVFFLITYYNLSAQNISGVINIYTPVTQILNCPSGVVVGNAMGFNINDRVLIIQMQGATIDRSNTSSYGTILNYNEAGNYEYADISSVNGSTIYFKNNLSRSYNPGGSVQLIRVPVYGNVNVTGTLTCLPWNGSIGGVLAFEAGNISMNADIDISGRGFVTYTTMATGWNCDQLDTVYFDTQASFGNALKGDGIVKYNSLYATGRGPNANGGGGGNNTSGGGGGGSNYGKGGIGGYEWEDCFYPVAAPVNRTKSGLGGRALAYNNATNKIFMGGGGGMGQGTTLQVNWGGSAGGNGGGIAIIKAANINGNNYSISSKGDDGGQAKWDGGGGGGAGGTVLLDIANYSGNINVNIQGGKGGNPHDSGNFKISQTGPGGGGGGGTLWLQGISFPSNILLNKSGGANGLYYTDFDSTFTSAFGAKYGDDGGALINLSIPYIKPVKLPAQEICYGANATLSCIAPGNVTPYTHNWNPGNISGNPVNVSPTSTTTYTLIITDGNGCSMSPILDTVIVGAQLLAFIPTQNNVGCYGNTTGSLSSAVIGGSPGYSFNWNTSSTQMSISNLRAGVYTLTITDSKGCTAQSSATITEPPLLIVNATITPVTCNGSSDGSITVSGAGGTPGYTYYWTMNGATTATATGLATGIHRVNVTDNHGCLTISFFNITEPTALTSQVVATDAKCNGSATGSAIALGNGGTGNYTYNWSNSQTFSQVNGLSAGIYSVTITDANGCSIRNNAMISEPSAILTNTSSIDAHCNQSDGSASVTVSGGIAGYNYLWNNGTTTAANSNIPKGVYTITITDANGCTATTFAGVNNINGVTAQANLINNTSCNSSCDGAALAIASGGTGPYGYSWSNGQNNSNAAGLCAGTYSVVITDSDGCFSQASITITQPAALNASINTSDASCFGQTDGMATITPSGGTAPFSFLWSNANNSNTANNLHAGIYTCTVNDANGCLMVINNLTINEPAQIQVTTSGTQYVCPGSQTTITSGVTGGTPGYTYSWSNNNTGPSITVAVNNQSTYAVTVSDSRGCKAVGNVTVGVYQLPIINFTSDIRAGCGPLCVNFTNTTPNTSNLKWIFENNIGASNASPANYCYTNPGTYNVSLTVTDNNGCLNSLTQPNYITVYPDPVAAFSSSASELTTILNPTVYFTNFSQNSVIWNWEFGNTGTSIEQNPSYTFADTGTFLVRLIVKSPEGCMDSAALPIHVNPDHIVYIPNTFTPNNDGINDVFNPAGMGINENGYELLIFDRWGNQIFKTNQLAVGWDGTTNIGGKIPVQEDVYVWKVNVKDLNGKSRKYIGHVNVIR